jgi:type I restriction enzyme S subunit
MSWSYKKLDDLGIVARGKSKHRPRDAAHLYDGLYPFIQTGDVKHSNLYVTTYTSTYSEAGLAQSKLWNAGTLCITIAANIAETAILGIDACFPDSIIGFIPHEGKSDVKFMKYKFDVLKREYQQFSQGAAQDNLSMEKLLSLEFLVPEYQIQVKISSILSAYDDLIANNTRRVELLEQSVQELYKEWFVRLKFPGYEHTKIIDGVPEGWQKVTLGEICYLRNERVNPLEVEQDTPYVGLEHIPRESITLNTWGTSEDVTSTKLKFEKYDILFGKIRPYFHKVVFAPLDGICSSDTLIINTEDPDLYPYLLATTSSVQFVKYTSATVKEGSKMPRADWDMMTKYKLCIPPKSLLLGFNTFVQIVVEQLENLMFQNKKLQQARDLLLPKLMTGEIVV